MRIFVAGATGALAHALIPRLASAGHHVVGLSRNPAAAPALDQLGAQLALGDVLRADALTSAVQAARPDVVIHAAKAIPKSGPLFFSQMRQTNRIHEQGTRNLLQAAIAAGASRIIAESIVFAYGYGDFGDTVITEAHPTKSRLPRRKLEPLVDAVLAMENAVTNAEQEGRIAATVLRCGLFYGPSAGTDRMVQMMRRRAMPLPAGGRALWPVVYIDDAADAFALAAIREISGTFNIVDDHPVRVQEFTGELARLAQVPPPWSIPGTVGRALAPYFTEVACTSMQVSNERAGAVLGWRPKHPTYVQGLADWAALSEPLG